MPKPVYVYVVLVEGRGGPWIENVYRDHDDAVRAGVRLRNEPRLHATVHTTPLRPKGSEP